MSAQLGFEGLARVEIKRNIVLDKLALLGPSRIPERRLTISFAESIEYYGDENDQNIKREISPAAPIPVAQIPVDMNVHPNRSILKKNTKTAPFHVRGRRKSTISSQRPSESDFLANENNSTANEATENQSNALLSIANNYNFDSDDDYSSMQ